MFSIPKRIRLLTQPGTWIFASLTAFLLAVGYCSRFSNKPATNSLDFPIQVISTLRILRGEVPFRDFQTVYGPLGYYLSAAFVWLFRFHSPVLAFNCYNLFCLAAFYGILCVRFAKLRLPRPILLFGGALLIAYSAKILTVLSWYSLPMLLPVIVANETLQFTVESPTRSFKSALVWRCVTGALLAAETFIRFNFGLYLAVAVLFVGIGALVVKNKPVAAAALQILALTAVFLGIFSSAFGAAGILIPFLSDIHTYIRTFTAGRNESWPYVPHWLAICTAVSFTVIVLRPIRRILRGQIDFSLAPYIVLCGCVSYTVPRFDSLHLVPFFVFSLILICDPGDIQSAPNAHVGAPSLLGLPELQIFVLFYLFHIAPREFVTPYPFDHLISPGLSHMAIASKPEPSTQRNGVQLYSKESEMLQRLHGLRKPGDEIFWMSTPQACQSTFDWCTNLNLYIANGEIPRPSIWYFDTVTTPYPDTQQQIIQDLQAEKTPWIGVEDVFVPNTVGGPSVHSTALIDYVLQHYARVFSTDIPNANRRYAVYARRPSP